MVRFAGSADSRLGGVGWLDCGLATLYAAAYAWLVLLLTWLVFRRKSL